MTFYDFDDYIGDLTPEEQARIEALKDEARAEIVTYNLKELRRHRNLTQTELARRLDRAQASVSAMETAADNLVSTLRMAVEGMGGHLEVTAVFDDERIPLTTHTRTTRQDSVGKAAQSLMTVEQAQEFAAEIMRRVGNPRHAEEQRETQRLLADMEESFRALGYEDRHYATEPDTETDDPARAPSRPAASP